jgi:hypothetical protein
MTKVILNADFTVKLGRKAFKASEAVDHAVIVYDEMQLLQLKQLDNLKEIGTILLQFKAFFPSLKEFGQFIATTDLAKISAQDRSDAIFVATNWTTVQKLNKSNKLDSLGVSAIRKRITEQLRKEGKMQPKKQPKAAPKAEPKAQEPAEGKAPAKAQPKAAVEPEFLTEADLAMLVNKLVLDNDLDFTTFVKELTKIRKGA